MFKVGDWLDINGIYERLTQQDYNLYLEDPTYLNGCELWQPKEGEWFWLNKELVKITHISKYDNDEFYFISVVNEDERKGYFSISELEPFIGKLPSFIKD